jgi:pentatricopeptide repeat protein
LNLLVEARLEENFCRDPTMLIGALTASGGLAAFELCQQLHSVTIEAGFSYYRPVLLEVWTLYHEMRSCGEDLDSATYLRILSACSHAGLVNDGLMIFNQMVEKNRIKPSEETLWLCS